jgi:nucleoside-diphosphate-sugar epimerase
MNDRLAFLTGSTGFIGSHLLRTLTEQGWKTRISVRARSRLSRIADVESERVSLDLATAEPAAVREALRGTTHVFHVAGRVSGTPAQLDRVNRQGTDILIRAAAELSPPPVVLLVSSAAAGGPSPPGQLRREADPPAPISDYGRSKLAGESTAIVARGDCPLTIVRPGIVFGEGDTEFIRIFRAMTQTRINPMIGPGRQPLSMIEVSDLVALIIRAAEAGERVDASEEPADTADANDLDGAGRGHDETGRGIYHAADPEPLSLKELGQLVRREIPGLRCLDLHLPTPVGFAVGAASEWAGRLVGKSTTLNRDKIREARASGWALDMSKTQHQLSWQPARPLAEQLAATLHQARRSGHL